MYKDGGIVKEAAVPSSGQKTRSLLQGILHVGLYLAQPLFVHQRADLGGLVQRVADLQGRAAATRRSRKAS